MLLVASVHCWLLLPLLIFGVVFSEFEEEAARAFDGGIVLVSGLRRKWPVLLMNERILSQRRVVCVLWVGMTVESLFGRGGVFVCFFWIGMTI